MAAFDTAVDEAQRRMAELEAENQALRGTQVQQHHQIQHINQQNINLANEASLWRDHANRQPPPLLITPLPPLVPTFIFLLPLPSRVFLPTSVHSSYASPNLLVPMLRPMPLRKTNSSTSAVFWLARRVNGTTLSSRMTPFHFPPPTPSIPSSRK